MSQNITGRVKKDARGIAEWEVKRRYCGWREKRAESDTGPCMGG